MEKFKGPNPASFAKNGSEHGHQVALFCWASQNFDRWPELREMFAIPNGGERNIKVAANLKAEGVKSSVPDIFLPSPVGKWHGLFIELKRPKTDKGPAGRASTDQLEMIQKLRCRGYGAAVAVGWEEARDLIVAYLTYQ